MRTRYPRHHHLGSVSHRHRAGTSFVRPLRFQPHKSDQRHHKMPGFDGPTTVGGKYTNLSDRASRQSRCFPTVWEQTGWTRFRQPRLPVWRAFRPRQTIDPSITAQSRHPSDHHVGPSRCVDQWSLIIQEHPDQSRSVLSPQNDQGLDKRQGPHRSVSRPW